MEPSTERDIQKCECDCEENSKMSSDRRPKGTENVSEYSNQETSEILTVAEAADLLRVSKGHVYRLCCDGKIPHGRYGRCIRICRRALLELQLGEGSGQSGNEVLP